MTHFTPQRLTTADDAASLNRPQANHSCVDKGLAGYVFKASSVLTTKNVFLR
jgi:hypothetical protein